MLIIPVATALPSMTAHSPCCNNSWAAAPPSSSLSLPIFISLLSFPPLILSPYRVFPIPPSVTPSHLSLSLSLWLYLSLLSLYLPLPLPFRVKSNMQSENDLSVCWLTLSALVKLLTWRRRNQKGEPESVSHYFYQRAASREMWRRKPHWRRRISVSPQAGMWTWHHCFHIWTL